MRKTNEINVQKFQWWAREDSNLQPDRYERGYFIGDIDKIWRFRHANQRMFTIGCGQSLAKRWLDACVMALLGITTRPRSYGETWLRVGVH